MNPLEAVLRARAESLGCTCTPDVHAKELSRGISGTWFLKHKRECLLFKELTDRTTTTIGRAW